MTEDRNTERRTLDHLAAAAAQFKSRGEVLDIREHGHGNVHDTFLVTLECTRETLYPAAHERARLSSAGTGHAEHAHLTEHVHQRLERAPLSPGRRWEIPRVLLTDDARDHWLDPGGSFWRAISFIEAAQSFDTIQDMEHAEKSATALGMFHRLISDLPARKPGRYPGRVPH